MELFNEYENSSLQIVKAHINKAIRTKQPIDIELILNAIMAQACTKQASFNVEAERSLIGSLVDDSNMPVSIAGDSFLQKTANPACSQEAQIPTLPTILEREWLSWMLEDGVAAALLSPQLVKKLKRLLKADKIHPLSPYWQRSFKLHPALSIAEKDWLHSVLRKSYLALKTGKYVYYQSHDEYGNQYQGKAAPYKIEYSFWNNTYNLIMWNAEKAWTFKSNILDITRLDILEEAVPAKSIALADKYVASKTKTSKALVIQLQDRHTNDIERCFNLLTGYDKEVTRLQEDPVAYELKVFYSDFDTEELITVIHSLGSAVTVMSPPAIRSRIIEELTLE